LSDGDKSALILAQEKEILSLQRELHQTKQEVQKFLDVWPEPERLHELLAENERLRDVEAKAEIAKGETEALFRRACNLDRESEALRSMVQALGAQLLDAKKGLLDRLKIDGSTGGPFKIDHYDKAAENLRINLVDENHSSAKHLQERLTVTLIERDDLATKLDEMQKVVQKYFQNADENKESISSRDKAIADLREQLTNNQSFYEEAITEMQEEVKKSVDEATQLKSKLEEAHEAAMQQLQKYVDDLEATASAEQRSAKLQFQRLS
jgi:chromosome segregation ATPase